MEQLMEDMHALSARHWLPLSIAFVFLVIWVVLCFYIWLSAFSALVSHANKPCDEPLKYYLLIAFVYLCIPQQVVANVATPSMTDKKRAVLMQALFLPSFLILGLGLSMVWYSKTCSETNPELFYPARRMIYLQVFTMVAAPVLAVISLIVLLSATPWRTFLLNVSQFGGGPGCAGAVRNLPQVLVGAPELVSEGSEGEASIQACPICLEELSDPGKDIVRTPCGHHFHRSCLATWCTSRLTCPVCRDRVAEPDQEVPDQAGAPVVAPGAEP